MLLLSLRRKEMLRDIEVKWELCVFFFVDETTGLILRFIVSQFALETDELC